MIRRYNIISLKQTVKPLLARLCSSDRAQSLLASTVSACHYLMGIGSGSCPESSGEEALCRILRRLKAPYTVFDLGANKGQFLTIISAHFPPEEITLHCFEPSQHTFSLLKALAGDRPNVILNNTGIGRECGRKTLYTNSPGSGLASMTQRDLSHLGKTFDHEESIEVETLDRYCALHRIDHIHLLKIDIEGHELDALVGGTGLFDRQAVDLVTFEFGGTHIDTRIFFRDFFLFFQKRGMKLYRITPSGFFVEILRYREIFEQFTTTNFLAVREGLL